MWKARRVLGYREEMGDHTGEKDAVVLFLLEDEGATEQVPRRDNG